MKDQTRVPATMGRHPGRVFLLLGVLLALIGPILFLGQLLVKVLAAPWYVPILATTGAAFAAVALVKSRSVWRWAAAILLAFLAAAEWAHLSVALRTPVYTGPVQTGQPFPAFTATLADG